MTAIAPRWRTAVFFAAAGLVGVVHLIALWHSLAVARLWEDEAFNLTVPLNLLRGLGYTSDGTLSGSELTPFDPRISTGPVVLLPIAAALATGADLVVGARMVPALFFVALLVASAIIGRRVAGRWGALVAVAMPLVFTAGALPSPIQGPADILGEVPAAALLAWAVVALYRRPWLAGLLVGLAVQAKYISLLALPAVVVGFLLLTIGLPWLARLRRVIVPAVLVAAPTLAVELFALVSLGPARFIEHLRATRAFVRDGGQTDRASGPTAKLLSLLEAWYIPPIVFGVVAALAAIVLLWGAYDVLRRRQEQGRIADALRDPRAVAVTVAAIGLVTYLAWWITAGHLPAWVRHPAPGILAFSPALAAAVVASIRRLAARRGPLRIAASAAGSVLAATVALQVGIAAVAAMPTDESPLAAQRSAAAGISSADAEWIATEWGARVALVVLAGSHVALTDAPPEHIATYPTLETPEVGCDGPVLVRIDSSVLCAP